MNQLEHFAKCLDMVTESLKPEGVKPMKTIGMRLDEQLERDTERYLNKKEPEEMSNWIIYIKSHCELPDIEDEFYGTEEEAKIYFTKQYGEHISTEKDIKNYMEKEN